MKKLLTAGITLLLLAACGGAKTKEEKKAEQANKEKDARVYGFESGIIELIHGENETKEIRYFDRWGTREALYTYANDGEGNFIHQKTAINIGPDSYLINIGKKTGTKLSNPFGQFSGGEAFDYREGRQMKMAGAEKLPNEKVGNYDCEVWDITMFDVSTRTFLYKGLIIQEQIKMDGETHTSKLVRFEENAKVDTAQFAVPKDIVFE